MHQVRSKQNEVSRDQLSALAGLEAWIGLIDDVDASLAPDKPVLSVAAAQGAERVADFHNLTLVNQKTMRASVWVTERRPRPRKYGRDAEVSSMRTDAR